MSSADQLVLERTPGVDRLSRFSRVLGTVLLILVGVLLVEVLFEAWVQHLGGSYTRLEDGRRDIRLPEWPKNVKNALYLAILALTVVKVAVDRSWRRFTTAADIALAVLGVLMVVAGLLGGSDAQLIGEALFVYFRGVIVFYAWRAVNPAWSAVRPLLWVLGVILAVNSFAAIAQMLFGVPLFERMGWLELTWASIFRAHGFLDHPNHLGHVLALGMLGLLAWFVTVDRVGRRWWWLFALFAIALSATQSREATLGFLAGAVLIGLLRRGGWRRVTAAFLAVALLAGAQLALREENRTELQRRLAGVFSAFEVPSGQEGADYCVKGTATDTDECTNKVNQREIRVLYAQQGMRILAGSPLLGYGVGQFGGIVAEKDDPNWNMDPRFGPNGFDMHGSTQQQVDSFWLHLIVEVGILGALAYLVWLFFLIWPVLRARPGPLLRFRGSDNPPGFRPHPLLYWAPAALLFAVLVAFLSPAPEDPLFPPLLFTVLGLAWVMLTRGELVTTTQVREAVPAAEGD
jgi:hypothetical protein